MTLPPNKRPTECCRTCEYWDVGGEANPPTAMEGDCLNPNSDRLTPEWNHWCSAYHPDRSEAFWDRTP